MLILRLVALLGAMVLAISIFWAMGAAGQSLSEAVSWLMSNPWGVVTLIDLYLGFFLLAVLIWLFEPNRLIALMFILPLPFLGNVVPAIWLVWRLAGVIKSQRAA